MEVEELRGTAASLAFDVIYRNAIIAALIAVVLILTIALCFSMYGWYSTKRECSRSREEIQEIKKYVQKKSEQSINAIKRVC